MRLSSAALPLSLVLAACHPAQPKAVAADRDTIPAAIPADSVPVVSGALAGPINQSGIHSVAIEPDTTLASARRITNFSFSLDDGENLGLPVRVLLTDPVGRVTGRRPEWDSARNEIPGAYYDPPGDPDSVQAEKLEVSPRIMINSPPIGRYRLELFGIRARGYFLDFRFQRAEARAYGPGGYNCVSVPGRVDTLWIDLWADSSLITGKCYQGR